MEKVKENISTQTIKREVFIVNSDAVTDKWTRVETDGELRNWIPHDEYGELPNSWAAQGAMKKFLEDKYQEEHS